MRRIVLTIVALAGCSRAPSGASKVDVVPPATIAPVAAANPCKLDDAQVETIRTKVKALEPGMSKKDVGRVLGLDWSCLGVAGQGAADNFATASEIAPGVLIGFTWRRGKGDPEATFFSASISP